MRENEEQDTDHEKHGELEKNDEAAGENGAAAVRLRASGEQALHDGLVCAVSGHGEKSAANQAGPEGVVRRKIPMEIQELEFVAIDGRDVCNFRPAARNFVEQKTKREQASSEIQEELRDIGPDNRFHAAFERVEDSEGDHDEDSEPFRGAESHADDESDGGDADAFGESARDEEGQRGDGAHLRAETFFDERVGGEVFATEVAGEKENGNEKTANDIAEDELEESEVGGISDGGSADDGEGGSFRGDDGESERPPWSAAPTQEIIFDTVLLLTKPQAEESDADKVRNDNDEIEGMNAHQAPGSRYCTSSRRRDEDSVGWRERQGREKAFLLATRDYSEDTRLTYALDMRYVLGMDGGGTKTECVLMDEAGLVRAEGRSGPSNPMRVGFGGALVAACEAARSAISNAKLSSNDIHVVCAGLAGAAQPESQRKMKKLLSEEFPTQVVEVCTDVDLKLEATGEGRAIVLNVGTGTFAVGRDLNGQAIRVGGHGPLLGDEGSAYDVGRRAMIAALRASDRGETDSPLAARILREMRATDWEDLQLRVYRVPDEVFPRIFPIVTSAADEGDREARELLKGAADELAGLLGDLMERLELEDEKFLLVKSGGMMGRSVYFDKLLDERLRVIAPKAEFGELLVTAAEAAARLALRLLLTPASEGG